MSEISDELLARIAERAADPNRRYMTAAEGQSRIEFDRRDPAPFR